MGLPSRREDAETKAKVAVPLFLAGLGIIAAVGASSCCVLPLVFFALGVSGAWISNLTALAPYQPLFVAAAVACLSFGFVHVYCRPATCADETCSRSLPSRAVKLSVWIAAALVVIAVAFPYTASWILSV